MRPGIPRRASVRWLLGSGGGAYTVLRIWRPSVRGWLFAWHFPGDSLGIQEKSHENATDAVSPEAPERSHRDRMRSPDHIALTGVDGGVSEPSPTGVIAWVALADSRTIAVWPSSCTEAA